MKNKILFSIFFLLFNVACFSQNIDSIVNSKPKTKDELINIARELIYNEVIDEKPDIEKIRDYQNYLNENHKFGLYDDENLLLYYFIQDWDNAHDQIIICQSRFVTGRGHNTARFLSKILYQKIRENNILDNLQQSYLTQEQKDFFILYFNLKTLWNENHNDEIRNTSKLMIREFNINYPESTYSKYLTPPF